MTIYYNPKGHHQYGNGADWLFGSLNSSYMAKNYTCIGLQTFDVEPFTRDPRNPRHDLIGRILLRRSWDNADYKVLEVTARPGELDMTVRPAEPGEIAGMDSGAWLRLPGQQSLVYGHGVTRSHNENGPYVELTLLLWGEGPSKDFLRMCVCSEENIPDRWAWIDYEYDLTGRIYNRYLSGRRLSAMPYGSNGIRQPQADPGPRFFCEIARPNGRLVERLTKVLDESGLEYLKHCAAEDPLSFALRWLPMEDTPWREDHRCLTGVPDYNRGARMGDQTLFHVDLAQVFDRPSDWTNLPAAEIIELLSGLQNNGDISIDDLVQAISEKRFSPTTSEAVIEALMPVVLA